MKVIVCEPNKFARIEDIESNLESYQSVVGGYIEAFYPYEADVAIICNEEGKFNGSTPNRGVYGDNAELVDIIFGTFFICGTTDEDFTDIPEELIPLFMDTDSTNKDSKYYPELFYKEDGLIKMQRYEPKENN